MQHTIIEHIEHIADDVVGVTLSGRAAPLATWEPGAHIDITLPNWLTRQYSLCGDPANRNSYRIAVRDDQLSRGGSEYINLFRRTGCRLDISLPRNNFRLEPAPSYLFIAGGIGITPMPAMMQAAHTSGAAVSLLYIGGSTTTMPFATDLRNHFGSRVSLIETAHRGRPDFPTIAATLTPKTLMYCCGPESMLVDVANAFPAMQTRIERFQPSTKSFAPNTHFTVTCARSHQTIEVPEETSLLDALTYAGHQVATGCREGVCGSCQVTVLNGQPEHRDDIGAAPGQMYPCVSRALTPHLVLDLYPPDHKESNMSTSPTKAANIPGKQQ